MKDQLLIAAAVIKSIGRAYPKYIFSSVQAGVINHGCGEVVFSYTATAHYTDIHISADGTTLDELYHEFSLKLHVHFTKISHPETVLV